MQTNQNQNIRVIASLLIAAAITQITYTALYVAASEVSRLWLWGIEGLIFVLLAAFAGSALAMSNRFSLAYGALFASAILNVVQVGIGLTQFVPFREAAQAVEGLAPAASSVVALSFFIYNAAKILIALAALIFGMAAMKSGSVWLGRLTVLVGALAFISNTIVMMFGRIEAVPSGATGVIATLLLASCMLKSKTQNS